MKKPFEGTTRRVRAYVEAGAGMIFPDTARSEDDIRQVVDEAGVPVTINMGFGIRSRPTTPLLPLGGLKEIGVRRISLPRLLPGAAIQGMSQALEVMKEVMRTGTLADRPDLVAGIDDIMRLMDYDEMRALERKLLNTREIQGRHVASRHDTRTLTHP